MLNVVPLSKGANAPISSSGVITVELNWTSASLLDATCFMVNSEGKVPSDDYMIFYNQVTDPDQSVCLQSSDNNKAVFTMNLDAIPPSIHKCFLTATLDGDETFNTVKGLCVTAEGPHGGIQYQINDVMDEKALVLVEIYRHQGIFKFRAIGRGFRGGLKPLAESFGVAVEEEEQNSVPPMPHKPIVPETPIRPAQNENPEKKGYQNEKQSAEIEQVGKEKISDVVPSLASQSNGELEERNEDLQQKDLTEQDNLCANCGSKLMQNAKFCA